MSSSSAYDWDQAFLDFPQATQAAAGVEHDHHADNWPLQDQGHSDTHSSDPSYSPPPLSPAYPPQQALNFRTDEVAQDFHAPFGYQQEWTDGATTGVAPSQVSWAGRPSVPSSSSTDPPLVNPSVTPSALSQPPRPQIPPPTPVHSRLDFFLQPASFTPALQAYNPPHHASSSIDGESQGWAGGCRKRSRSDKENDSDYSPLRPVKRAREQPDHDVSAIAAPQPMLAPSTSHNINLNVAAEWTRSATSSRICERRQSRSNHLSARHVVHQADGFVRAAASSRLLGNSERTGVRNVGNNFATNLTGRFSQLEKPTRSASWNAENATYRPQHNEVLDAYPPIMGAHAPIHGGDDGYHGQTMYAPYTYPPPVVPLSPPHPAPPIPDARPVRPDIIPPSLSRRVPGLRRSQRTLSPRAPAVQNTAPTSVSDAPQGAQWGAAREMYPGSNSVQARQRAAQRAARRSQAIALYPRRPLTRVPVPAPTNADAPSSSRIGQQHLRASTPIRRNPPPIVAIRDPTTGLWPCPMLKIDPREHCPSAATRFTRQFDSERHFQSEHLRVRYRMLRGPHRGCGEYSRRDALKRHVEDCRKYPGAPRVVGRLEVLMPCWNSSEWHKACSVPDRRKWEHHLGRHGLLVYECECCQVSSEEPEDAEYGGVRTTVEIPVKIKEEEADETGALYLAGSRPHSEETYESEEDAPCTVSTGEPQITQAAQASDGNDSSLYFPNDLWIGFCGAEDNEAGTDSNTSSDGYANDLGGSVAVQTEESGPHMLHPHAIETASSRSTPAHNLADDWQTLEDPEFTQCTSTGLFSDEGDYDADVDAEGSDSETDARHVGCPQRRQPTAEPVEVQPVAHEDSADVPLGLGVAPPTAAADTSCGH